MYAVFSTGSSSDVTIATIDSRGTATGVAAGAAEITIEYQTLKAVAKITVTKQVMVSISVMRVPISSQPRTLLNEFDWPVASMVPGTVMRT